MKKVGTEAAKARRKISAQKVTVGLDLGDRNSWYCVLDESGQIQLEHGIGLTHRGQRRGAPRQANSAMMNLGPRRAMSIAASLRGLSTSFNTYCRGVCDPW
jgi:hypothetical protein